MSDRPDWANKICTEVAWSEGVYAVWQAVSFVSPFEDVSPGFAEAYRLLSAAETAWEKACRAMEDAEADACRAELDAIAEIEARKNPLEKDLAVARAAYGAKRASFYEKR